MTEPRLSTLAMVSPNDWPAKTFVPAASVVILLTAALSAMAAAGLPVPALTQTTGFIFVTFLPGLLLLRIMRIHNTGFIECIGYAVGLSLAVGMAIMLLLNALLPAMGIAHPLSLGPVATAFVLLNSLLLLLAYARDNAFAPPEPELQARNLLVPALALLLLLTVTILAARLADAYGNNVLLIACLICIALLASLAAFGKFITPAAYPLAIFIIGLCLLYQTTLMTPYLIGSDIYLEYFFFNLTATQAAWNSTLGNIVNSCLSITLLAPLYSLLMDTGGLWVFKAVFPVLFALVPVIMYRFVSLQTDSRTGFLAAFLFIAIPTFSLEMISLCRQQVAELFLSLLILLLVDRKLGAGAKIVMALVFSIGIIVSHYGIGTIGFIYMALLFPLAMVIGSGWFRSFWGRLAGSSGRLPPRSTAFRPMLLFILAAFFFIAGLSWYYFTSSGINFTRLIDFWTQHSAYITSGSLQAATPNLLSNPAGIFSGRDALVRTAIGLDFAGVSLQGQVFRVLQLTIQALLVLGIFYFILRPARFRFVPEFLAFCTVSTLILAACIILPGFAERFNTTRMFHLALLTLSPFVIIGCLAAWELAVLLVKTLSGSSIMRPASRFDAAAWGPPLICTVIIIPYYILCSGLVFEISGQSVTDRVDTPYSIALSRYRLDLSSSFSAADGAAASWLAGNSRRGAKIYTDHHTPRLLELMSVPCHCETLNQESRCTPGDYAFLSGWNISQGKLTYATYPGVRQYLSLVDFPLLDATRTIFDRIYNNGAAQVLCIPP